MGSVGDLNNQIRALLRQGLVKLDELGQSLAGVEFLNRDIPLLNQSLNEIFGLKALLNIGTAMGVYLDDPDLFTAGVEFPSMRGLKAALEAAIAANLSQIGGETSQGPVTVTANYDAETNELRFDLSLEVDTTFSRPVDLNFNLAEGLATFAFNANASVGATFTMNVGFGIDVGGLIGGASPQDAFFLGETSAKGSLRAAVDDVDIARQHLARRWRGPDPGVAELDRHRVAGLNRSWHETEKQQPRQETACVHAPLISRHAGRTRPC